MGASFGMIFFFLATLLGGGAGNHLLDYAFSDAYWKSKNVNVTVQTMLDQLATLPAQDISPFLKDLESPDAAVRTAASKKIKLIGEPALPQLRKAADSPDPEVAAAVNTLLREIVSESKPNSIRRLMAIRTLGELKKPQALATLKTLVNSKEMFVDEYAAKAIAQIEKKPYQPAAPTPENRKTDLALLPGECRIVAQATSVGFAPVSIDAMLDKLPMAALGNVNKDKIKAEMTDGVIKIAEEIGDVRIDGITAGVSGDPGPNSGFAAAIVQGQYDAAAVRAYLTTKRQIASRQVAGLEVFSTDDQVAFILPSNDRVIAMAGANAQVLPIERFATALKTGKGSLLTVPEMKNLIDKTDTTQPLWGIIKMTDEYRQAAILAPFETLTFAGKMNGQNLELSVNALGVDAAKVAASVDQVNGGIQMGLNQMRPMVEQMPFMRSMIKVMEGIKCAAKDQTASLTATVDSETAMMVVPMLFGDRAVAQPQPPAQAPGIAPPPPPIEVVK